MGTSIRDLVEHIAKTLVDQPEEVAVTEVASSAALVLELKVGDGDLGKIIGKHGRIILAMRVILASAAGKDRTRVKLDIVE